MMKTFYMAFILVLSRLDYANSLLFGISAELLNKLQRVQNSAAKFVTGASYRDHVTPHLIALHWLPIKQRIEYKIALLVFRCRHGLAPTHLVIHMRFQMFTIALLRLCSHTCRWRQNALSLTV